MTNRLMKSNLDQVFEIASPWGYRSKWFHEGSEQLNVLRLRTGQYWSSRAATCQSMPQFVVFVVHPFVRGPADARMHASHRDIHLNLHGKFVSSRIEFHSHGCAAGSSTAPRSVVRLSNVKKIEPTNRKKVRVWFWEFVWLKKFALVDLR